MPQPVLDLGSNLEENLKGGRTSSRVSETSTPFGKSSILDKDLARVSKRRFGTEPEA
jgi:hypothetical protein